jgi:uncharacterized protein
MNEFPLPDITPLNEPYWNSVAAGHLSFQRCAACGLATLPARDRCPRCLQPQLQWERASGVGRLVSWIVYHHAFHEAFVARLPYVVAVIELAEGPRMISNVIGASDPEALRIDAEVMLAIDYEGEFAVPRFKLRQE